MSDILKRLKGKTAVVTGASSGIGLEFCRLLAANGANLVMISNQRDELSRFSRELSESFGIRADFLEINLCDSDATSTIDHFLDSNEIPADILINNAGIFSFNALAETSPARVDAFVDLHVRAVTQLSRAFAIRFAAQGHGHILNMSSMSCWMPMPGLALYSATKAYIRVMSRSLHYEMKPKGVFVTVACPGGIATDLFGLPLKLRRLAVNIGALQTPERFAGKALKRMLRGKAQYINGFINRLSILFVGCTPEAVRMLVKKMLLDKGITRP